MDLLIEVQRAKNAVGCAKAVLVDAKINYDNATINDCADDILSYIQRNEKHSNKHNVPIPWRTLHSGITWKLKELVVNLTEG